MLDLVTEEENKMNNTLGYDMSSIGEETNSHNQVDEEILGDTPFKCV